MKESNISKKNKPKNQNIVFPLILFSAGLILILIFAFMITSKNRSKIPDQDKIPRISVQEAQKAFESGEAVFLDARVVDTYTQSHIPGALNIPVAELETRSGELDPQQWIITYCT